MEMDLDNPNPEVFQASAPAVDVATLVEEPLDVMALLEHGGGGAGGDDDVDAASLSEGEEGRREEITSLEVFNIIRDINDPEHPYSLEQLNVAKVQHVWVDDAQGLVQVQFTPTIPHCSMSTLIGLSIRVKLMRSLPSRFKVDVAIFPGSHAQEEQINKQLSDKERVAAAVENPKLVEVVNKCIGHQTMF